jgi:hypothetical protein
MTRSRSHGHVDAILTAIRQLGLDTLISREPSRQRNLVLAMIVQRLIVPRSKLGTTREWDNTTLADELNIDMEKKTPIVSPTRWTGCSNIKVLLNMNKNLRNGICPNIP